MEKQFIELLMNVPQLSEQMGRYIDYKYAELNVLIGMAICFLAILGYLVYKITRD